MVEVKCLQCGNTFKKYKSDIKKYCNRECWHNSTFGHSRGGWKFSEEIKKKLSIIHKGKKHTEEHNKNVSLAKKGKKFSEEHKIKLRESRKKLFASGYKPHNYKEDRSTLCRFSKQGERRTSIYFNWRKEVWKRDNFKCRLLDENCSGRIEAHHILGWSSHPELRYEINNGITLCHAHHPRKRAEEKRLAPYFNELVSVSKD